MRKMMVAPCQPDMIFTLSDPDAPSETEFEGIALRAFGCLYPQYRCVVFGGRFLYEEGYRKPDLAMIAHDNSHWFIVEVELLSHSLDRHVLPQVQAFRYGEPQKECASILSRELGVDIGVARTLVDRVPRAVVVVANGYNVEWERSLSAHQAQFLTVSRFVSPSGSEAFEINGALLATKESLGFGVYSAPDTMIRFTASVNLPDGPIQMETKSGGVSLWRVIRDERYAWIAKETGRPDIQNGAYVQLIRTMDGKITMRM